MSSMFKNRIRTVQQKDENSTEVNLKKYGSLGIKSENNRLLSPYTYLKFYNKVVENTQPFVNSPNTLQQLTPFQFYPFNKIEIPIYLEKDHQKRKELKNKIYEQSIIGQDSQQMQDELTLQKRTEELLNKIAENNKKQENVVYRTHNSIPVIEKNFDQIDFIDQTQKKYFSITKQLMDEINKHKKQTHINTSNSKTIKENNYIPSQHQLISDYNQNLNTTGKDDYENFDNDFYSNQITSQNKKGKSQIQNIKLANKLVKSNSQVLFPSNSIKSQLSRQEPSLDNISPQLIMRNQMRGNVSQAVNDEIKLKKLHLIQTEKNIIKDKYKKKMDHISKNKNPELYMSKCVLDRRNITLHKILSSIPQKKLMQIYEQKKKNFIKTLEKTNHFTDTSSEPLKQYIKPRYSRLFLSPNNQLSKRNSDITATERERFTTLFFNKSVKPKDIEEKLISDNVLETYQLKPNYLRRDQTSIMQTSSYNSRRSIDSDSQISQPQISSQKLSKTFENDSTNQQKSLKFLKLELGKISSNSLLKSQINKDTTIENEIQNIKKSQSKNTRSSLDSNIEKYQRTRASTVSIIKTQQNQDNMENRSKRNSVASKNIKIIDQKNKKQQKFFGSYRNSQKIQNDRTPLRQNFTETSMIKDDLLDHYQKVLRVKNPGEVLSTIFKRNMQIQNIYTPPKKETGYFQEYYQSLNTFNIKQNVKNQYYIRDKLARAFNSYNENHILETDRSRRQIQNSEQYGTPSIKRCVTISNQPPLTFGNAVTNSIEQTSIFDFNKYFKQKYSSSVGFSLNLSKQIEQENDQFQNKIQNIIDLIEIKGSKASTERIE